MVKRQGKANRKQATQNPPGKDFEILIAKLYTEMSPDAVVVHDQKVIGRSDIERQLDVTLTQKVGTENVFVVIECKDESRPVTIEAIDEFASKLEDVRGNLGVIISVRNFTVGARKHAKRKGIRLLSYRQAQQLDWTELFREGTWLTLTQIIPVEPKSFKVIVNDLSDHSILSVTLNTPFLDAEGKEILTLNELLKEIFHAAYLVSPEIAIIVPLKPLTLSFVRVGDELYEVNSVVVEGRLTARQYTINLNFAQGDILEDELNQKRSFGQFHTESMDWRQILDSHPYTEIAPEQYLQLQSQHVVELNPNKLKKYIRLQFTEKPSP